MTLGCIKMSVHILMNGDEWDLPYHAVPQPAENKQKAHSSHIHQAIFHNLFKTNDQSRPSAANLCLLCPLTCGSNNYQQAENVYIKYSHNSPFLPLLNCKVYPVLEEVGDLTANHISRLTYLFLALLFGPNLSVFCDLFGGWVVVFLKNCASVYTTPSSSLQLHHNRHLCMIM